MSLWEDVGALASHAWNGNDDAYGDAGAVSMDLAHEVPFGGLVLPEADTVRDYTNHDVLGHPASQAHQRTQGNWGNHLGTVIGGIGGAHIGTLATGGGGCLPGAAYGMALGSDVGGWIADRF